MDGKDSSQVNTAPTAGAKPNEGATANPTAETPNPSEKAPEVKADESKKTFTQEDLDKIVKDRLAREDQSVSKRILDKYGCKDEAELDAKIKQSLSYEATKSEFDKLSKEHAEAKEELAFAKNAIDPSRIEDIRLHFKGKGIELNTESLKAELPAHPEWVGSKAQTTIAALGSARREKPTPTEDDIARHLWGMDK